MRMFTKARKVLSGVVLVMAGMVIPDFNDAVGQAYGGVCCQTVYASTCRHPNGMEFDYAEWVVGQALC